MFYIICKLSFYSTIQLFQRLMILFISTNPLILIFVSFSKMIPMTYCLLIQCYFLSCLRCLDSVNYLLLLAPKVNDFSASLKIYCYILHRTPSWVLCSCLCVLLIKFVLIISQLSIMFIIVFIISIAI